MSAELEETIAFINRSESISLNLSVPRLKALADAAAKHLATLPRTKPADILLVAHMNGDGTAVFFCQPDTAVSRAEIERGIRGFGGQLVELRGVAQVPE